MKVLDFIIRFEEHAGFASVNASCRPLTWDARGKISAEQLEDWADRHEHLELDIFSDRKWTRKDGAQLGEDIFRTLFSERLGELFRESARGAMNNGDVIRLVINYALPEGEGINRELVHDVPWELLFDPENQRFLALDDDFLLVRHLWGRGLTWASVKSPVRVFLTSSCPNDQRPLSLEKEMQQIRATLMQGAKSLPPRIHEVEHLSQLRLHQEFNFAHSEGKPFHVWHHGGHGYEFDDGTFGLALHALGQDKNEPTQYTDAKALPAIVARHPDLQLVVMNVCLGARKEGLASLLASLKVPAVIGFHSEVRDSTAIEFAHSFWRRLLVMPVDEAIRGTRQVIACNVEPMDFSRVQLFLRSLERPRLFGS